MGSYGETGWVLPNGFYGNPRTPPSVLTERKPPRRCGVPRKTLMPIHPGRAAAALLLTFSLSPIMAQTPETPVPTAPTTPAPADLTLGGYPILRLRGAAGGLAPEQRIDVILGRLTPLLGVPNIQPSDVVVFLPSQTSRVNRAPVIYALGRPFITVDPATVKAAGGGDTMTVATRWAKRLQQLPCRVSTGWPPNAPEPKVPANPPLTITGDFTQVGGMIGTVALRGKVVLKLRGPQTGRPTAAERAAADGAFEPPGEWAGRRHAGRGGGDGPAGRRGVAHAGGQPGSDRDLGGRCRGPVSSCRCCWRTPGPRTCAPP